LSATLVDGDTVSLQLGEETAVGPEVQRPVRLLADAEHELGLVGRTGRRLGHGWQLWLELVELVAIEPLADTDHVRQAQTGQRDELRCSDDLDDRRVVEVRQLLYDDRSAHARILSGEGG
jgi:hypothetical protein